MKHLISLAFLLVWFLQSTITPPKSKPYVPTCGDYRLWYEQAREREYATFRDPGYRFTDLKITTYPDRRELRADELMEILNHHRKELQIDTIAIDKGSPHPLNIEELMYPQYFDRYTISKEDWKEMQRRAKASLAIESYAAAPEVVAHWKSIASGTPPFGLKVRTESAQ